MLLLLTDKLTKNLVTDAISRDKKDNLYKAPRNQTTAHLNNLVKTFCSCGVSFSVWEKQNADGKGSGLHDFTSLMGTDKKLLLEKLPAKLDGVISPATSSTVIKIWQVFSTKIQCTIPTLPICLEEYVKHKLKSFLILTRGKGIIFMIL